MIDLNFSPGRRKPLLYTFRASVLGSMHTTNELKN
jgi:hypothetical protein